LCRRAGQASVCADAECWRQRRFDRGCGPLGQVALAGTGYYINTASPDDERRLRETYGDNYPRLVQIKDEYDPKNLFRLNSNIKPSAKG
jgi:Berberine and berberine like